MFNPLTIPSAMFDLVLLPDANALFQYVAKPSGRRHAIAPPVFEVDGVAVVARPASFQAVDSPRRLANGTVEHTFRGSVGPGLSLVLTVRVADDSPVVRFRYALESEAAERRLTKSSGRDAITYAGLSLAGLPEAAELRLSTFAKSVHTYMPDEVAIEPRAFDAGLDVMGPILLAGEGDAHQLLLAYEHGSTYPDAYLQFHLAPDRTVELRSVKGNYVSGDVVGPGRPFHTIWFQLAAVDGTRQNLADRYRHFVLHRFAEHDAARQPHVFYNTWNFQERNKNWLDRPYLEHLRQERMLTEIDAAHAMGIEVFVIDTGWYGKTGDWRVNADRFPDHLAAVKRKLDGYGMRLGLWFDNAAALSSNALAAHRECVVSKGGAAGEPTPIWETEESHRMCLVSRYANAWADEMIRLHHEVGVTYFKWDAIGQYGCDDPHHDHGGADASPQERAERFSFLLPLYMAQIAARISAAVPQAICDFDMTESHRCVGLAFLAAGKFFLINNGPYYWDFDIPREKIADGNANLFFFPGPARTWFMRQGLAYDRWIPSTLLLTHFLPDDPRDSQENGVASLVLGQNGIWGDLPAVSAEGKDRIREMLAQYKTVRHDVAEAPPRRQGIVGSDGEVHEKINPATGRGVVCIFATGAGTHTYVTDRRASTSDVWHNGGVEATALPDGRVKVVATFAGKQTAKLIVFGGRAGNVATA